jgi:beta-lactamase superfamily II metal-dependent hydrolase
VHEIDFLPVGDGKNSGDAIAIRFAHPDDGRWVHVIVDAGFQDDGEALVEHVKRHYGTDHIDHAILTHPDGDHIGGMGEVVRGLSVDKLWLHDIGAHGGGSLPAASAVKDLIKVAGEQGTTVQEAWAGASEFDGALTVLGPDKSYYQALVQEQLEGAPKATVAAKALVEAARGLWDRVVSALGIEVPFSEKEVTPRNNSSMIVLLRLDEDNHLLTGDAGVPALERAWDFAEAKDLAQAPHFVQIPHHGSRRNASSAWLDRLLGGTGQSEGIRTAFISVVKESEKHPSGRIVNAYIRRGCTVIATAGQSICHRDGTPNRPNWGPAPPVPPMEEEKDDD